MSAPEAAGELIGAEPADQPVVAIAAKKPVGAVAAVEESWPRRCR